MSGMSMPMVAHAVVLLLSLGGFACLALAMVRHQEDLFGSVLSAAMTRTLRVAGWLLLALAAWVAVARMGWGFGLTAYSGHTSAAAGLVVLGLVASNRLRGR